MLSGWGSTPLVSVPGEAALAASWSPYWHGRPRCWGDSNTFGKTVATGRANRCFASRPHHDHHVLQPRRQPAGDGPAFSNTPQVPRLLDEAHPQSIPWRSFEQLELATAPGSSCATSAGMGHQQSSTRPTIGSARRTPWRETKRGSLQETQGGSGRGDGTLFELPG